MLKDLINENLISLNIEVDTWIEAIKLASKPLIDNDIVNQEYVDDMIDGVNKYGPYIVITKGIAIPHGKSESGCKKCGIAIATLSKPINFGNKDNDPVKYLFPLSAIDSNAHMEILTELIKLFEDKEFFKVLDKAKTSKEVMDYLIKGDKNV